MIWLRLWLIEYCGPWKKDLVKSLTFLERKATKNYKHILWDIIFGREYNRVKATTKERQWKCDDGDIVNEDGFISKCSDVNYICN